MAKGGALVSEKNFRHVNESHPESLPPLKQSANLQLETFGWCCSGRKTQHFCFLYKASSRFIVRGGI